MLLDCRKLRHDTREYNQAFELISFQVHFFIFFNFACEFERCIQEPGRNRNLGSGICQELHQLFVFKLHLPEKMRGKDGQCTLLWTVHLADSMIVRCWKDVNA